MRPFMRALVLGLSLAVVLPLSVAGPSLAAPPATGEEALARLEQDRRSGRIDDETYLLEAFRYVFAPDLADSRYVPRERTILKCFTTQVLEFQQNRQRLSAAAVAEMDRYLAQPRAGLRASYVSPSGRFQLTYSTSGANAVPSADTNPANGIPDFVERCAEYADFSWDTEITSLGFTAPLLPSDGTYDISFASMGAYGFTSVAGPGLTQITLHHNFIGFPPNSDPDGNQLGAAKVTVAHEFKHASQYTNNSWSEGGWVELDATWMEDIVYDLTNDYYNYINSNSSNSQLSDPWLRLDNGGTGSYEDCLWQHYLSEQYGNQFIVDLWDRRAAFPGETMKKSYQETQLLYGTNWDESWPSMYEWCWFTGSRAEPPFGFGEAPQYKRMNLMTGAISAYPYSVADNVDQISAHPYRFNPGASGMAARIVFNGLDSHANFTVSVITEHPDGTFSIVRPALDANNDLDYTVPEGWDVLKYVGVIVTNSKRSGGMVSYSLDVSEVSSATDVTIAGPGDVTRLTLRPAQPNPFTTSTRIRFTVPRETRGSVRIYDVAGRTVRILHDGMLPAGTGEVAWDGSDSRGRHVPAGVYWSRIETAQGSVARKITVLR